jgi:hypothetical protein
MHRGYVKLWRKSFDSGIHRNHKLWVLFTWLIANVTHKKMKYMAGNQMIELLPGQIVTGRKRLAEELGMSPQQIRTCFGLLVKLGISTIKSTNKYSIITIINWDTYQAEPKKSTSTSTNKEPTNNQQSTTKQECKEQKNNRIKTPPTPHQKIIDLYHKILPEMAGVNLTETLKKKINARWKEQPSLDWWTWYFTGIRDCPLLMGKKTDWIASFTWLTGPQNMTKVLNGEYNNATGMKQQTEDQAFLDGIERDWND